ncbi:hypothetical protein [Streptomyces sp. CC224B]|uniref:hypothetical protein n=1 Tax=Streptomyces sp. CC224B TaxID=3044571 RepID=UPI0024A94624|nr:hypothetical protein [Streptomyces sp. CC224B]
MNTEKTGRPQDQIKAIVVLTVAEVKTTHFPVVVEAPTVVAAAGPEALAEYIALNDDAQFVDLPVEENTAVFMTVSGRDVDDVTPPL